MVCYFVWQILFWFLVRLPSVRFLLSDLADCLVGHNNGLRSSLNGFPCIALLSLRQATCPSRSLFYLS